MVGRTAVLTTRMSEMHRRGHTGIAMLAYAPVGFILLREGQSGLALGGLLGVLLVEPLPDNDFWIPGLQHRGIRHSLLCALLVGSVLGVGGWVLGMGLNGILAHPVATLVSLPMQVDDSIVGELVGRFRHPDRETLAGFGFAVGVFGVLVHLVGDIITVAGIRPLHPFSSRRISVSSLRSNSTTANTVLFAFGVIALVVVIATTAPGVAGSGAIQSLQPCPLLDDGAGAQADECVPSVNPSPADLTAGQDLIRIPDQGGSIPTLIGTARAQDTNSSANGGNGSVQINKTASNRTRIELESVTLPRNGFIVARAGDVSNGSLSAQGQVVGHTQYVRHGTFGDVVLTLDEPINGSQTVSVTLHNDTNGNRTWDGAKTDAPYRTSGGTPVHDTIRFESGQKNTTSPSVTLRNQTTNGSTVTVRSVTLSKPGFVALHTSSYADGLVGPNESVIAVSKRLSVGTHQNVTITVSNAPPGNAPGLNQSQLNTSATLAVTVYADTNGNKRMDSVQSFGETDSLVTHNGTVVSDIAGITVPSSEKRQQASVSVRNQSLTGDSLTVESARLPDGGFLVVHNDSYLPPENAPLESAVGVTKYLKPGQHRGVSVPLLQGAVTTDQTLVVVPYRDTNGNQRYDYITSDGFRDVAYEDRTGNQSAVINETVSVTAERTESTTESPETATTTPIDSATPFRVTNLSVSNRTAHVGDEVTVTARITNPTGTRLEGELALATAGEAVETQQVALFPRESRAVTFTHSYDAAGNYVIKVANHTKQIRVAEEGTTLTPLTSTTVTNADATAHSNRSNSQAAKGDSSGSLSLTDIVLLVVLVSVLAGLVWVLITLRKRV
jgi:membrane-bound metal-dependent hydrolase YbcI (DUF457 family)